MAAWWPLLLGLAVLALLVLLVDFRRYSRGHFVLRIGFAGRGLYVSRTPDGTWWRVWLRAGRGCSTLPFDEPPDAAVREPRRPLPRGPFVVGASLDLPD